MSESSLRRINCKSISTVHWIRQDLYWIYEFSSCYRLMRSAFEVKTAMKHFWEIAFSPQNTCAWKPGDVLLTVTTHVVRRCRFRYSWEFLLLGRILKSFQLTPCWNLSTQCLHFKPLICTEEASATYRDFQNTDIKCKVHRHDILAL